jgi:histidine triad (HIT) family protein
MPSIFTKIISGEIPSYKIAEDENYFAFLDIFPLSKGHTLVVPKRETDYLFDLEDDVLAGMMVFSKKVALAIGKSVPCLRVGVAVVGLEVPHAHIHLIPLHSVHDIDFSRPKLKLEKEEFEKIAEAIRSNIDPTSEVFSTSDV